MTPTYRLTFQPTGNGPPAIHRVRALLKAALRSYGLRCVDHRELDAAGYPLPQRAVDRLGECLTAGAATHGADAWRSMPVADHVRHAEEHLRLHALGDVSEPHLVHAAARLLFAVELAESVAQKEKLSMIPSRRIACTHLIQNIINRRGGLVIDRETAEELRAMGFARSDVAEAIGTLAMLGLVAIVPAAVSTERSEILRLLLESA